MISYLCALFLITSPSIEDIEALKEKEEKAWVAEQKEEIALLKEEKKRLQEEVRSEKEQLHQLALDVVDKKANVIDLFPLQVELQHKLYFIQILDEEIDKIKERVQKGLFGEMLARKRLALTR